MSPTPRGPKPKTIPVVTDTPAIAVKLGFGKYVDGIIATILGGAHPQHTIGLYGSWGTGKSSLLNQVKTVLNKDYKSECEVISIEAWRFDRMGTLLPVLLHELSKLDTGGSNKSLKLSSIFSKINHFEISGFAIGISENSENNNQSLIGDYIDSLNELSLAAKN